MKRNKGFSLIELVVVIAIMSIFTVGVVTIVISQSDWYCRKAADEIDAALSETRSQALAKSSAWMELAYDATDGYVIRSSYAGDTVLGNRCVVTFETNAGGSAPVDVQTTPLILSYARASGAFLPRITSVNQTTESDGMSIATYNYAGTSEYCTKITVTGTNGGGKTYELTLYPETGKHKCEKK